MRTPAIAILTAASLLASVAACNRTDTDEHAEHAAESTTDSGATSLQPSDSMLPAGATDVAARLAASPRHAEWAMIATGEGSGDSTRAYVVYPERADKAPVVLVIHEIFGLTPWIRGVADQLAKEGYIAIAPDLLTRYNIPGSPLDPVADSATAAIRSLSQDDANKQLDAVARWGMALPAAMDSYGVVGFCWGGGMSFAHAVHAPGLDAAVVYYGTSPESSALATVHAPVLGLYAGDDARVNSTVAAADSAMKAGGHTYSIHTYEGAGHGFLRQQDGRDGANMAATQGAWPETLAWFRQYLGN